MVVVCMAGCAASLMPWGISETRARLAKLEVGMTKSEVVTLLGQPYNREVFPGENGETYEYLIYITQYTDSGAIPDTDKTPVCLVNGRVIGWGRNFYDRTKRYEVEIR